MSFATYRAENCAFCSQKPLKLLWSWLETDRDLMFKTAAKMFEVWPEASTSYWHCTTSCGRENAPCGASMIGQIDARIFEWHTRQFYWFHEFGPEWGGWLEWRICKKMLPLFSYLCLAGLFDLMLIPYTKYLINHQTEWNFWSPCRAFTWRWLEMRHAILRQILGQWDAIFHWYATSDRSIIAVYKYI